MANRLWGVAVLTGMVLAQASSAIAGDLLSSNGGAAPYQSPAAASLLPGQTNQGGVAGGATASFTQPVPGQWPAAAGSQPGPVQVVPSANGTVRLPTTGFASVSGTTAGTTLPAAPQAVNGTFRDDGEYVTITVDRKEVKLLKPRSTSMANIPGTVPSAEGTVRGRLMQNGRPLSNCRVVIVPLEGEGKNYRYDANREPLSTVTDNEGVYFFDHVPAAKYKLTWLPVGTNQWIRRIAIKPDVVVRPGQAESIITIGAAQRTIN